jgi:hypothetical protein
MTKFAIGMVGLSLVISYVWWLRVRLILFRQEVLDLRDALFDKAMAQGALDDPGYRDARERMNTTCRLAQYYSLPLFLYFLSKVRENPALEQKIVPSRIQPTIDDAMNQLSMVVVRHIFTRTLTGLLLRGVVAFMGFSLALNDGMTYWTRMLIGQVPPDAPCGDGDVLLG